MTMKHFSVEYDKVNDRGTFSPGDRLSGRVVVVTGKEVKVQCLLVKAKGKVEVKWPSSPEGAPPPPAAAAAHHHMKKKYFYFEHILLQDKKGDGSVIIGPGKTVFSFTFEIPERDMPSSYEGKWGRIAYSLRAKLTQSIWLVHKAKTHFPFLTKAEFPFVSKSESIIIGLKEPQYGTRISFYGCGKVTLNVTSERMGLTQGESMEVTAEVLNESASAVTPVFHLCEKQTFVAGAERAVHTEAVPFGTGDSVPAAGRLTVSRVLTAPPTAHPTFFNCCMMKLEYRLRVTLHVPHGRDLEVRLPLVILRGHQRSTPEHKHKTFKRLK